LVVCIITNNKRRYCHWWEDFRIWIGFIAWKQTWRKDFIL